MYIDSDTKLYCLIGNPITKSLSPMIHNLIFQLNSINARYLAFDVKNISKLEMAINGIRELGIQGFNVTIPYKIEVMKYLDEIDEKAKMLGAVNTVVNLNGTLKGFNTDGDGFIKSLRDIRVNLKNKRIVLVGAGGAAYSIAASLAYEGIKELIILNRTLEKANKLKMLIENYFPSLNVICYEMGEERNMPKHIDILINATPMGMYPNINDMPISPKLFSNDTLFYDIIYKPSKTKLLLDAEKLGFKTLNGLDMLVNQAIYAQKIWTNKLLRENIDWSYIKRKIVDEVILKP